VNDVSARWLKASRALKKEEQVWAEAGGGGEEAFWRGNLISMFHWLRAVVRRISANEKTSFDQYI